MADVSKITTVQLEAINNLIATAWATMYVAMGTGGTEATASDSALETESAEDRTVAVVTQPTAVQVQGVGSITSLSGQTIKEYGAFSAADAGTLYARANVTAGQAILTNDIVQITFLTSLAQA